MSHESAASAQVLERRLACAWTWALAAFAAEVAAVAGLAGACALAAVLATAPPAPSAQQTAVVILCAACGGGAFVLARRPRHAHFARDLDARLGFAGALSAAAGARGRSPVARLLAAAVVGRLPRSRALVVVVPSLLVCAVAPVLAWALVREAQVPRTPARAPDAHAAALVAASAEALERAAAAARAAGTLASGESERLHALADRSRELVEPRHGAASTASVVDELAAASSRVPADPAVRSALERLERAVRSGLSIPPARDVEGAEPPARGSTSGAPASVEPSPGGNSSASGLASPPSSGTMAGSTAPVEAPAPAGLAPAGEVEGGVGAARWWPRRHDAVVERWLAARAAESTPR